jgi:hypothetical protein
MTGSVSAPSAGANNPQLIDPQLQAQIKAQMADIIEPAAVGIWPLAWGWWVLITLILVGLLIALVVTLRHHRANRYRRTSLKLLQAKLFSSRQEQYRYLMQLSKQVALVAYPEQRTEIANAFGAQWLTWLNSKTKQPLFNHSDAVSWQNELYAPPTNANEPSELLTLSLSKWIQQHKKSLSTRQTSRSLIDISVPVKAPTQEVSHV